jgi:hypothetical protein
VRVAKSTTSTGLLGLSTAATRASARTERIGSEAQTGEGRGFMKSQATLDRCKVRLTGGACGSEISGFHH